MNPMVHVQSHARSRGARMTVAEARRAAAELLAQRRAELARDLEARVEAALASVDADCDANPRPDAAAAVC